MKKIGKYLKIKLKKLKVNKYGKKRKKYFRSKKT